MIIKVVPKIKLPLGVEGVFDYEHDGDDILVGQIVEIPFRQRVVEGVVLEIEKYRNIEIKGKELKSITKVLGDEPMVGEREIGVMKWMAEYYFVAISNVVTKTQKHKNTKTIIKDGDFKLTVMRSRLGEIKGAIDGIVGSDENVLFVWNDLKEKILVYIKLIEQCLKENKQVLIILPQVSDIEFLAGFLSHNFGSKLAILQAGLGKIAQYTAWRRIQKNQAKIILGTRSSILAPMKELGMVIIDEEEANDHKQYDMNPRYDVRRIAMRLGVKVVFGSSAPRVETYSKIQDTRNKDTKKIQNPKSKIQNKFQIPSSKFKLVVLSKDFGAVELVDMVNELTRGGTYSPVSLRMEREIKLTLDSGKKVILFLNRKGMATMVVCRDCQYLFKCEQCGLPLVYHEQAKEMVCHHCGMKSDTPLSCLKCSGKNLKFVGTGTERVEKEARKLFPTKKVIRIDKDATYYKVDISKYDIIVGTQLLLKDFRMIENLGLFGIISLDAMMQRPDFRMGEKLYQLVAKILVWARFNGVSKVLWQSFSFENELLQLIARQDYEGFFEQETPMREKLGYPPFLKLVKFIYKNVNQEKARFEAGRLVRNLRGLRLAGVQVIGPVEPLVKKVGKNYVINVILKMGDLGVLRRVPLEMLRGWLVDVEPEEL